VTAADAIEIDAPIAAVRAVPVEIESWPAWDPDVGEASTAGEPAAGTEFNWKDEGALQAEAEQR
jgi:hypothetical protein